MSALSEMAEQIPFDLPTRPALAREDFLVGPENQDAAGWIDKWPDWPAPALILSGPAASGKTHLAAVWQDRSGAASIDGAELEALEAKALAARGACLLLDGVDPWIGDRAAETTLFHLYNMTKEKGGFLLLTMRSAPARLDFAVPDLASRLRAAPVAMIHPPEDSLLAAVLIKQFYDRQLHVGEEVIRYILPRMERSFAAARDLVMQADALALAEKRPISIPLIRRILAESL